MYMCSNTGLSGWAELRNRTRLCFHTMLKLSRFANFPTRFFLRSHPRLPLDSSISQNTSDGTILV
ncbi:hypothetical protein N7455_000078 [Penicillium solitum]|uniref:uncharacterized protein n=1 Tax=Penicillium solitum TaxID=60172 RepID=UPI0032C4968B|nr:hypothetical protein N7536_007429 [Penicillium majusculum]KAJ5876613.1 hypothetical protein N7455_000078 [Penicillium solitum]